MSHWSLGVLVGLPIILLVVVLTVPLEIWGRRKFTDNFDRDVRLIIIVVSWILRVVTVGILVFGFYPYGSEYHKWIEHSGTVTDISSRILGDGDSSTQKFVVIINGQELGCNDTRCALIKKGDTVTLSCKRTFQYSGTDGYDCNYVRRQSGTK